MRSTRTDRVVLVYGRVNSTGTPLGPEKMIFAFHDAVGAGRLRGIFVWGSRPLWKASGSTWLKGLPVRRTLCSGDGKEWRRDPEEYFGSLGWPRSVVRRVRSSCFLTWRRQMLVAWSIN